MYKNHESDIPLISVIMPVYNSQEFVGAAIESVLSQIGVEFELIVVDDGSTDQSAEVIQSFSDKRLILISQSNAGYGAAMNSGMAIARGTYVARMDSDDLSKPNRLQQQVAFLSTHTDFVIVGTLGNTITPKGYEATCRISHYKGQDWEEQTWDMLMNGSRRFVDASVMFPVDAVKRLGGYRNYQRSGLDVDMWLRLLENGGRAAVINQVLYSWRIGNETLTSNPMSSAYNKIPRLLAQERRVVGTDRVMRGEALEGIIPVEVLEKAKYWYVQKQWDTARACMQAGDWVTALRFVNRGLIKGGLTIPNVRRLFATLKHGVHICMH